MAVDLNKLRDILIENQNKRQYLPSDPNQQVVVDRHGNVIVGADARPGEITTVVPQETFAR